MSSKNINSGNIPYPGLPQHELGIVNMEASTGIEPV